MNLKTKIILILSISITSLFAEFNQDVLTIGPLKQKLIIDKIEKDQIIQTASGDKVTIEEMVAQTKNTDVYIIGESHTNYQCHTFQRDFIEALVKNDPKIVVGFEFFNRDQNGILEKWRNGEINEDELLKETGWYNRKSFNYGYTKLIMDVIKEYKIKVIGLNVSRDILRTVSRKGFDKLTKDEQNLFPTINIPNPEHEYFIKGIFGDFAVQNPARFNNVYMAQKCWDVIMAESMRETLAKKEFKNHKGVIIAGGNHVAYKLGIPFRYKKADKKSKITNISSISMPEENSDETESPFPMARKMGKPSLPFSSFTRGIADYVVAVNEPAREAFPNIGLTVKLEDEKIIVTKVSKESIAEKNGIKKGDQVISLDGIEIVSVEQFYTISASKSWDNSLEMKVIKKIEVK